MADCIFCRIAAGEIPAKIVYQDDDCVAFRDVNPQAPTHVLVIPRKHVPSTNDLAPEDADIVGRMTLVAKRIAAEDGIDGEGYRLVINSGPAAGQSVPHLHMHLLGGRSMQWPPG